MRYQRIIEQVYFRPWYITPAAHASIRMLLASAMNKPQALDLGLSDLFPQRRPMSIKDGVASIHVMGPLGKNLSKIEQSCGATGYEQIRSDYEAAIKGGARGILLEVDSPGGTVMGAPEIAELIASKALPTVAYTEDIMASAAYYIASGSDAIVASPSAAVGSIGVYIPWIDSSAQYEAAGLKPDPIVNTGGDLKALGFGGKLTEVQRSHLQAEVDADFAQFKKHVTTYRPVSESAMRGQVVSGRQAVEFGLVESIGDLKAAESKLREMMSSQALG